MMDRIVLAIGLKKKPGRAFITISDEVLRASEQVIYENLYGGHPMQKWETTLWGIPFTVIAPEPTDWESPEAKREVFLAAISWAVAEAKLIPHPGLSVEGHEQIHSLKKFWGQD